MSKISDFLKDFGGKTKTALNQAEHNDAVKTFGKKLGGAKTDEQKAAEKELASSKLAYEDLVTPDLIEERPELAQSYDQGESTLGKVGTDPAYRQAQMDQLAALKSLAANGGRSAASDANLAQIQQNELATARGQRDAILQNANARGMGGSGATLLAQLASSQNATNNQSLQDQNVLAQQQNAALQAGQSAATLGANLENTDYAQQANKAAANDAINRFNSTQRTGVSQNNANTQNQAQQYNTGLQQTGYQNQFQKQAGLAGANMAGLNYNSAQANMGAQQAGNLLGGLAGLGTAVASKAATAGAAAHGGRIPGHANVSGDSPLNDTVNIAVSPSEVVVPRTLAKSGSPMQIADFVKHPPQVKIPQGAKEREAMLSALANLRRRR